MNKFSVVIPLYNKRPYVRRCLDSVLRQTLLPAEVIVVDDGSTDGSRELVETYAVPLIHLFTKKNGGVASARNYGIDRATGDIVAFLDADDEWEPGFLEALGRLARQFPQAAVLSTGYRRIYPHTIADIAAIGNGEPEFIIENYFALAKTHSFVTASNTAVRKEAFQHVGMFAEGEKYSEDQDMWVRLALHSPIAYSRQVLANYYCDNSAGLGPRPDKNSLEPPVVVQTLRRIIEGGTLGTEQKEDLIRLVNKKVYERFEGIAYLHPGPQSRRFLADNLILSDGNPGYRIVLQTAALLPGKVFYVLGKISRSRYMRACHRFLCRRYFEITYRQPTAE